MTLSLSRADLLRHRALTAVDHHYARRLAEIVGPLGPVHALKRAQALAGGGPLVADDADREAILARAAEQDEALRDIEAGRLALKDALRAATTAAQLHELLGLSGIDIRPPSAGMFGRI